MAKVDPVNTLKDLARHNGSDIAIALSREVTRLEEVLGEIAKQKLPSEMDPDEVKEAEWQDGYEACVETARRAIAKSS